MRTSNSRLHLPRWAGLLYAGVAIGLAPWIVTLAKTLPERHLAAHWGMVWVGFDIGMLLAALLTAVLAFRRSWWVCLPAMSVFTFLVIDSWFDVLTSQPGAEMTQAVMLAALLELPLALISFWLAYKVFKQLTKARG